MEIVAQWEKVQARAPVFTYSVFGIHTGMMPKLRSSTEKMHRIFLLFHSSPPPPTGKIMPKPKKLACVTCFWLFTLHLKQKLHVGNASVHSAFWMDHFTIAVALHKLEWQHVKCVMRKTFGHFSMIVFIENTANCFHVVDALGTIECTWDIHNFNLSLIIALRWFVPNKWTELGESSSIVCIFLFT